MQILCFEISDEFFDALVHHMIHLNLPIRFQRFDPAVDYELGPDTILLAENRSPEDIKLASKLLKFRKRLETLTVPVLLVTEQLSPVVETLFSDKELFFQSELPFDVARFLSDLESVRGFYENNFDAFQTRFQIQKLVDARDFTHAKLLLDQIQDAYPYPFQIEMFNGIIAFEQGNYEVAETYFSAARESIPDSLDALNHLAKVYLRQSRKEELEEVLAQTNKVAEIIVKNLIHWGTVYLDRGEIEKPMFLFEQAAEKDPANIEASQMRMATSLLSGNQALTQQIIESTPHAMDIARLCNTQGIRMATIVKNFEVAEKLYTNAMAFLPDENVRYKLWYNLGLAMKRANNYQKALEYFQSSKAIAPAGFDKIDQAIEDAKKKIALMSSGYHHE